MDELVKTSWRRWYIWASKDYGEGGLGCVDIGRNDAFLDL